MPLLIAVAGGVLSGIVTTALTIRVLGRRAILDVPNQRSSHARPTVRGGGIGLATGTLVALAIAHTDFVGATVIAIFVAGLGFGAIGLADDLTGALCPEPRSGSGVAVVVKTLEETPVDATHWSTRTGTVHCV
jgi:UDP-N-acetylmuramyl pentapeptide phosphotransferase/UDP-N-acetylglucosamine-1-phosphate transferase